MGNLAIFPLIYGCKTSDIVVIHINIINGPKIPKTAQDILNRVNKVSLIPLL